MDNETKSEIKKCSRCKKEKNIDNFLKGDKKFKKCNSCRERVRKSMKKDKCAHNRQKRNCKDCNGSSICIHKKQKHTCKICNGSYICIHKKQRNHCKICNNEKKITIINMIRASKQKDKKYNRYNQTEFIDKCFVKNLIEDSENKCYYCSCDLQYLIYQGNLATIERLDNNIGHIKGNCVIACRTCNYSRVGDKYYKK